MLFHALELYDIAFCIEAKALWAVLLCPRIVSYILKIYACEDECTA